MNNKHKHLVPKGKNKKQTVGWQNERFDLNWSTIKCNRDVELGYTYTQDDTLTVS